MSTEDQFPAATHDDGTTVPMTEDQKQAWKRIQKERDEARTEAQALKAEVETARSKEREASVSVLTKEAGLTDRQTARFLKDNPSGDVTKESVVAWAGEYDIPLGQGLPHVPPAKTFTPTQGGLPAVNVGTQISEAEHDKLMLRDPAAAIALANRGGVAWSEKTIQISS